MKKQVPSSVAIIVVIAALAGIGAYYYIFMKQPVQYTVMPEPMVGEPQNIIPPSEAELSRLIVGLKKSNVRLAAEQLGKIQPLLEEAQSLSEPNEERCDGMLKQIQSLLTSEQRQAIQAGGKDVALDKEHPLKTEAVQQHLDQLVKGLGQAGAQ